MIKTRNILGTKNQVVLARSNTKLTIMEPISEEQEIALDKMKDETGSCEFNTMYNHRIPGSDILAYGTIDINSEGDITFLQGKNIINMEIDAPMAAIYYTGFNYDKGVIESNEEGVFKWTHTWDKIEWFKYNHCLLGKPTRIIIYDYSRRRLAGNRGMYL